MRSRMVLRVLFVLCLLIPLPGFAAQRFRIEFDGFDDATGNGEIDCGEVVTYLVSLSQDTAPPEPETGFISAPFMSDFRFAYIAGSVEIGLVDDCTFEVLDDLFGAVVSYACDPHAGDPLDQDYLFQFRLRGHYRGGTLGAIIVDARNDQTSPTVGSQNWVDSSAGPLHPCPAPPNLALTKSVASGDGSAGATLVYGLSVVNLGNASATVVVLEETVPALTTFEAASSSAGWVCTPDGNPGSLCTLNVGALGSGATATRTFAVRVASSFPPGSPSTIDNTACASSTPPDETPQDNCDSTSTPAGSPDLASVKSILSGNGNPGSTLVYNLAVSNTGNQAASGAVITDTVPALATFLPGASSPEWSCTPNNNAGSVCTLAVGTVAPGATVNRTFAVQLAATFPANQASIDNTACSSTTTVGDPAGNNCGSVSTPAGGNPDVRTMKTVTSGSGEPGSTLLYSLTVTNLGNRDATAVQLTDTVPALSTFLPGSSSPGWSCNPNNNAGSICTLSLGTVAAGASLSRTFAVQLAPAFPGNPPSIDNTACSTTATAGDPPGNNCGSVSTPPGGGPDLRLNKTVGTGNGEPGSTVLYSLAPANTGTRDAAGVQLTDTVPALSVFLPGSSSPGWSCSPDNTAGSTCTLSLGTLPAGASVTRTFTVRLASSFPSNPPPISNTACASTTTAGDPPADNCSNVSTPPGGNPDVRITKSVASGNGDPGSVLVYQLAVSNAGTRDAAGVALQETVPQLTSFLAAGSSPGWVCSPDGNPGSTCTLTVGTLASGGSSNFNFAVQVASTFPAEPPPLQNTACVSTTSGGDPQANNCGTTSTPPGGNPDVQMVKTVASGSGDPGAVLVYQLAVSNAGTWVAEGVSLEEAVPALTTFLPASSSPGWVCTPDGNAGSTCRLAVGTLPAGSSAAYSFAVQVAGAFPPNPPPIENTACITPAGGNDPAGNDCGSTSTPPGGSPDLRVSKSVSSGDGTPGSILVYSLQVSNLGTWDAADVSLEETVPQLTTFLAASSSPGWVCTPDGNAGSSCSLSIGTVAAGSSATYTFAVAVAGSFPADPPPIENTACASTPTGGGPEGNDCGSTSTPPGGSPDVRLAKSVAGGDGTPGSVLVYALEVSNLGTWDAADVSLEETVPQLTTFLPASSSPGWVCTPDGNAGSSCSLSIGTIEAGSSATYTFAVRVASSFPADPPPIENTACVSTPAGGGPEGDDCGSTSTPPGGFPDVRLTKTVESGSATPGSVLVYALEVSNIGTHDAAGVSLEETVPQLTSFLPASSSPGWVCTPGNGAGSTCSLTVGTVPAGSSMTFTFAVQVASSFPQDPPPIENTACVETSGSGDPSGNDCGSTSTPPGGHPDLRLTKTVASGSATPGSVLVYTLGVANIGTRDAEDVSLAEIVPQLTTFLPGSSSPGWACVPDGNAGSSCTLAVGTVPAGSSVTFNFAVQVAASFPPDPPAIENSACVSTTSGGDPSGNDCDGTSTPPGGAPDLALSKSLASGTVVPNGVLVFTLAVHNQGNGHATGVVLQETVSQDSTFEAASSSPGWSCTPDGGAGSACTLLVGSVEAGATASYAFAVRLRSDLPAGTSVTNAACVVQEPGSGDPDNCSTVEVDPPGPQTKTDIEVSLEVDETRLPPGAPFLFTLTVRNVSTVPAEGLRLSVMLPSFGTEPTALDPACQSPEGTAIECSLPQLSAGASVQLTWKHAAFQVGDYTVSAELMTATPEDVDSRPGNGVETEDDFARVAVSVSNDPAMHDIPTLSTVGISVMVVLLIAFAVVFLRRGNLRSAA